jgi:hypothetical protein
MTARVFTAVLALAMIAASAPPDSGAPSARDLAALKTAKLIYIATVRKDGTQSKPAPVWFIMSPDNSILIQTGPTTWKAKRIRRGSPAMIWIDSLDGPAFAAHAEIVGDKASQAAIIDGIPAKYTMAKMGFARPSQEKFDSGKTCVIRFTVAQDLPADFHSNPGKPCPPEIAKLLKK